MLKIKKLVAVIALMCMVVSICGAISVSAANVAWYHLGTKMILKQVQDDVAVISVDVEKKQDLCYMLTMSSPKNEADPYSTSSWANVLSIMLASDGSVRCFGDGGWLAGEEDGANIGEIMADGEVHNIKINHNMVTKIIKLYIDDIYAYTVDYSERIKNEIPQCNMIVVSGDNNNKNDAGIAYSVASVMGTEAGELGVELADSNENEKTVTLNFSEAIIDEIEGAVLKSANIAKGEKAYALTPVNDYSSTITFEYSAELESLSEYIVVLPEGMIGKFGSKLKDETVSVVTSEETRLVKNSDYTTYNTNIDIKILTGETWNNRKLYDFPNVYEVFSWQGNYGGGAQQWFTTCNWGTADSNAIPTGSKVSVISYDITPKRNDMAYGITLTHNVRNNNSRANGIELVFDQNGNILTACGVMSYGWSTKNSGWDKYVIGKYKKDETINIKYVIDKPNKKVYLYLNNELKSTIDETGTNASKLHTTENSYLTLYEMFGYDNTCIYADRETIFLLDNVKFEIIPEIPYSYVVNSDYTAYDTNKDIKIMTGTTWNDRKPNKFAGAYEVYSWQGKYDNGREYKWNTYNWGATDSKAIPTGSGVSTISFDVIPKKASMQMGFDLRHDGSVSNNSSKGYEIVMDENGNILAAPGAMTWGWTTKNSGWDSYVIGKYEVDKPFNIKYEIDKPNKTLKVYIDNVLKRTVVETTGDKTSLLNTTTESYLNIYEMFGSSNSCIYEDRETIFLLDNVKLEVNAVSVSEVNFNNADGEKLSAFATSESAVETIDVYMNSAIDKAKLDSATKLYCDNAEIAYTSTYNTETNCYTITPASSIEANGKVVLEVAQGVTNGVVVPKAYKTYIDVKALNSNTEIAVTDANGEVVTNIANGNKYYIKANISNYEDDAENVRLIVGIYNGNALTRVIMPDAITVESGSVWEINKESDNKIEIEVNDSVSVIKAFLWDIDLITPVCENAIATKAQ